MSEPVDAYRRAVSSPELGERTEQVMELSAELHTLKAKLRAMAEEYDRQPRWLRSTAVADLMRDWLGEYR